jgi:hypothetical protein
MVFLPKSTCQTANTKISSFDKIIKNGLCSKLLLNTHPITQNTILCSNSNHPRKLHFSRPVHLNGSSTKHCVQSNYRYCSWKNRAQCIWLLCKITLQIPTQNGLQASPDYTNLRALFRNTKLLQPSASLYCVERTTFCMHTVQTMMNFYLQSFVASLD